MRQLVDDSVYPAISLWSASCFVLGLAGTWGHWADALNEVPAGLLATCPIPAGTFPVSSPMLHPDLELFDNSYRFRFQIPSYFHPVMTRYSVRNIINDALDRRHEISPAELKWHWGWWPLGWARFRWFHEVEQTWWPQPLGWEGSGSYWTPKRDEVAYCGIEVSA